MENKKLAVAAGHMCVDQHQVQLVDLVDFKDSELPSFIKGYGSEGAVGQMNISGATVSKRRAKAKAARKARRKNRR